MELGLSPISRGLSGSCRYLPLDVHYQYAIFTAGFSFRQRKPNRRLTASPFPATMADDYHHLSFFMSLFLCLIPLLFLTGAVIWLIPAAAAPPEEDDDDATVHRAQKGDRTAFNRLVGK